MLFSDVFPYLLIRAFYRRSGRAATREAAAMVIFRIATLHGLILALAFAEELYRADDLQTSIDSESNTMESIYFNVGRYDKPPKTDEIRSAVAFYVHEAWRGSSNT